MLGAVAARGETLAEDAMRQLLYQGLEGKFARQRVLVLIPDHTRTAPLPMLFRMLADILHDVRQLDFMVALGTHPPLSEERLLELVGLTKEERTGPYRRIGLFNHAWDDPETLLGIGVLSQDEVKAIAGETWHPTLGGDVPIRINWAALEHDHLLILGPTFPHEVAGFSGGAKYLFPGVSGPEMINVTHWLGALSGVRGTIGLKDTPVRRMIHAAAERLKTPVTLLALVVEEKGLSGIFVGDLVAAWQKAADLTSERHVVRVKKPFERVLSWASPMYDELWTAGKAMYKLEPALAAGGELILYAPHLETVSRVHGEHIFEIGYHVLPYFLAQWERFRHVPLGVLAHSTHVRGDGRYEDGMEQPRAKVTLASRLSAEVCERLGLGYQNPDALDLESFKNREDEGILFVPKAGEVLYRAREAP